MSLPQSPMRPRTYQRPDRGPIPGMGAGPTVPMGGHDPNTPIPLPFDNRDNQGGVPMGGHDPNTPGGSVPRGIPQWPGMQTQNTGNPPPPWLMQQQLPRMQNPYQAGVPQWPGQTPLPPWLMPRQSYQMGQPQWPGMQQRPPWMRQQGGPGRY